MSNLDKAILKEWMTIERESMSKAVSDVGVYVF